MQNIRVHRYDDDAVERLGFQGSIAPEDDSWILFIGADGHPTLLIGVDGETEDGQTVRGFITAAEYDAAAKLG